MSEVHRILSCCPTKVSISTFPSKSSILFRANSKRRRQEKPFLARIASTIRRRRVDIRSKYDRGRRRIREWHGRPPKQNPDGLVYHVRQLPAGHTRHSLLNGLDAVVEVMRRKTSLSSVTITIRSSNSKRGHGSRTHFPYPTADQLGDEIFSPDDFDRFLSHDRLKPLPTADTYQPDQTPSRLPEMVLPGPLIPMEGDYSQSSLSSTTAPKFTDSPPASVDELYFGNSIRLNTQSLFPTPPSPVSSKCKSSHIASVPACKPTPSSTSEHHTCFDQMNLLFSDKSLPNQFELNAQTPPSNRQTQSLFLRDDETHARSSNGANGRGLVRRRGSQNLRLRASIELNSVSSTSQNSRKVVEPVFSSSPNRRYYAAYSARKSTYQACQSQSFTGSPSLPPIPPIFPLLDELNRELSKSIDGWENLTEDRNYGSSTVPEHRFSLIDLPMEDDLANLPSLFETHSSKGELRDGIRSSRSPTENFTAISALLPGVVKHGNGEDLSNPVNDDTLSPERTANLGTFLDEEKPPKFVERHPIPINRTTYPTHSQVQGTWACCSHTGVGMNSSPHSTLQPELAAQQHTYMGGACSQQLDSLPIVEGEASLQSFQKLMTKATVDRLLDADSQVNARRACQNVNIAQQSSLPGFDGFEWHRWVDREFGNDV